jgi:hypothetical protein
MPARHSASRLSARFHRNHHNGTDHPLCTRPRTTSKACKTDGRQKRHQRSRCIFQLVCVARCRPSALWHSFKCMVSVDVEGIFPLVVKEDGRPRLGRQVAWKDLCGRRGSSQFQVKTSQGHA